MNNFPIDLQPKDREIVLGILRRFIPDRAVYAFGSRVNGKAKATSDLDLTVMGETPLDTRTLGALQEAFSVSRLPMKVDIVDWAHTSEAFRTIIDTKKAKIQ